MNSKKELELRVFIDAQGQGIGAVLFRNAVGRTLGLNVTESECLALLAIRGKATPTEVSRYTGLTSGATTALLDRLEKTKFIRRTSNPADGRSTFLEIDTHWLETAGPLVTGVQEAQRKLIAAYSAKELAVIDDFLTRFTQNVSEYTEKIDSKPPLHP
jgi:DNA-binding MarR family transcriptional regulator